MDGRFEDSGTPNPRQAEVDRIREAAAASTRPARTSDHAVPLRTGGTDRDAAGADRSPSQSRNDD